jgi:hypothetical protein
VRIEWSVFGRNLIIADDLPAMLDLVERHSSGFL